MFAAMLSLRLGVEVTKSKACIIMIDLKSIRAWFNPGHADNWVDIAGWGSLGGELADPVPTEWTDAMVEAMVDAPVNRAGVAVGGQFQREAGAFGKTVYPVQGGVRQREV